MNEELQTRQPEGEINFTSKKLGNEVRIEAVHTEIDRIAEAIGKVEKADHLTDEQRSQEIEKLKVELANKIVELSDLGERGLVDKDLDTATTEPTTSKDSAVVTTRSIASEDLGHHMAMIDVHAKRLATFEGLMAHTPEEKQAMALAVVDELLRRRKAINRIEELHENRYRN